MSIKNVQDTFCILLLINLIEMAKLLVMYVVYAYVCIYTVYIYTYRIAGKFGEFGELSAICQTKIIQISSYNNKPLVDLFICQLFFSQTLEKSTFAKLSTRQTFLLHSIYVYIHMYIHTSISDSTK